MFFIEFYVEIFRGCFYGRGRKARSMLRMMAPEQPPSDPLKSHVSIKNEQFLLNSTNACRVMDLVALIHLEMWFMSINHDIYLHNKVITGQNTFRYWLNQHNVML